MPARIPCIFSDNSVSVTFLSHTFEPTNSRYCNSVTSNSNVILGLPFRERASTYKCTGSKRFITSRVSILKGSAFCFTNFACIYWEQIQTFRSRLYIFYLFLSVSFFLIFPDGESTFINVTFTLFLLNFNSTYICLQNIISTMCSAGTRGFSR